MKVGENKGKNENGGKNGNGKNEMEVLMEVKMEMKKVKKINPLILMEYRKNFQIIIQKTLQD